MDQGFSKGGGGGGGVNGGHSKGEGPIREFSWGGGGELSEKL